MRFHKKSPLSPLQCIYVVVKRSTEPETGQCCRRQRHHHLTSTATRWRRPHIILYVVVGSKGGREGLEISMTLRTMFFANISLCYNIIGCCIHNSNTDLLNYTASIPLKPPPPLPLPGPPPRTMIKMMLMRNGHVSLPSATNSTTHLRSEDAPAYA